MLNIHPMKKMLSFVFCCFICSSVFAQLPYSKMMWYDDTQLKENKFKYDKDKNQYVLKKSNGLNNTINVLNIIGGTTADIKPHEDDYVITIQYGNEGVSSMNVLFYSDESFHKLESWMLENNVDFIETNSGNKTIQKFNYDDFLVELYVERIGVTSTTLNTSSFSKNFDESYNIYSYTIYTGIAPSSKWHNKEMQKRMRNEAKGKKKDIEDLF